MESLRFGLLLTIAGAVGLSAHAGTFKAIVIDGSFDDWAGVPLASTQPQGTTESVAYKDIYVANDNDYLYVRFTIYPPAANPFTFLQNLFIDADNNEGTGYVPFFGLNPYASFGSEVLIQSGVGYQQKGGGYNEGAINGLNWASAPAGAATEFEFRISRHATFASDSSPLFAGNTISFALESEDAGFTTHDFAPTNGSGGLEYTFASAAGPVAITDPTLPLDRSVATGSSATFQVAASGSTPLFYQWFRNGGSILNATNSTYTIASVTGADDGTTYFCRVTNSISSTNSRTATLNVSAGNTFRTITIDGSFTDWAGIPAYTQPRGSVTSVAYKDIYVCNDADYLYIRFSIYPPADDPFTFHQNIFIDRDNTAGTGFAPFGFSSFGSELLIQSGAGYQQKNGGFNEGAVNGLDWLAAPTPPATEFECRISRNTTFASDSTAVFTHNTIALVLMAEDAGSNPVEYAPTNGSGGLKYTFATAPISLGPLSISQSGANVTISWPGAGTLQARDSVVSGTWTNVPGASSPHMRPVSPGQLYFRLIQ